MLAMAIAVGALVTFVEPGTNAGLCGRVVSIGEGAGGVPTVWAVQQGGSRGIKAPLAEVTLGCEGTRAGSGGPPSPGVVPTAGPAPRPGPR